MNKVMSRTPQPRPRHRPPTRRDPRRPGGAPPRTPIGDRAAPTASPATGRGPGASSPATPEGAGRLPAAPPPAAPRPRPTDLFADRLVAVLSGQRPVHWMLRHTAGRAYDDLARLAEHGPLRAPGTRPLVRDIGYYVPRTGALEVFARVAVGDRLRALAFRLEQGHDLRWRCVAVETDAPGPPGGPA
ncbi:Rv3235 family protein [Streptomyces sp. TG1A-8]|uniref:Rv3235 family protein n=1 Tax=Streptomyces sp. TG1A-8 TaxID=3051385 RepID=UPI00265C2929|nr:Rv3235 family protein [Streptomyces sp. TG1A-8]MDO0927441.1 Rv3235 family protein [Streptomyces sp. TG1A-8]